MLWGGNLGALEIRAEGGSTRLLARFPHGAETEPAPGRREVIAPRAFAERIEAGGEIHLLAQHDYAKPLASTAAGTLSLRDTPEALEIRADLDGGTSWAADFLAAHRAGLIRGLSPGFRVQDGGERIERRGADVLRTITRAALFELSAVTRPAYPSAQIEQVAASFDGQLTATMQLDDGDADPGRRLLPMLERMAGRVLCNGFPTGVEVADAMVHGGPYPASTNFGATSVGTFSIRRFLRPVCYQNLPKALMPEDLRQGRTASTVLVGRRHCPAEPLDVRTAQAKAKRRIAHQLAAAIAPAVARQRGRPPH